MSVIFFFSSFPFRCLRLKLEGHLSDLSSVAEARVQLAREFWRRKSTVVVYSVALPTFRDEAKEKALFLLLTFSA
jgi:hypothetical protein